MNSFLKTTAAADAADAADEITAHPLYLEAVVEMAVQLLTEPCFDSLRTKQQLGYIVHCGKSQVSRYCMYCTVQCCLRYCNFQQ